MPEVKVSISWINLPPMLHLAACAMIYYARGPGWIYMCVPDFPFSILELFLLYQHVHPMVCFGVLGTLWWYFLSYRMWVRVNRSIASER